MSTSDRVAYLASRDERRAAERAAAPRRTAADVLASPVVIRVVYLGWIGGRHQHNAYGYGVDYQRIILSEGRVQDWTACLFAKYPDVDWRQSHDYYPALDRLFAAPDCDEPGGIPEDDGHFGGTDPIMRAGAA